MGNRISGVEGKLGQFEGRLGQVDAKADKALNAISNLRLERRFVVDMKEGANFAFGSSNLPNQAQKEIDGFLSDLKGDPSGAGNTVFVVAGHTDNVGTDDINYELAKRRADAVSRYLITQKKMDPLKVMSVSYGESAPLTENNNPQNRAKNRRVEILVYRERKTVVALYALLRAVEAGKKGALMAPTETLAEQHFLTLEEPCRELCVEVALLTRSSKTTRAQRSSSSARMRSSRKVST